MENDLKRTGAGRAASGKGMILNTSEMKDLMTHMKKEGITSFALSVGDASISIARDAERIFCSPENSGHRLVAAPDPSILSEVHAGENETPPEAGFTVTSPVVGVFYDSSAPEEAPYVSLGSYVKKGDVLCIIEAMKLMNEVTSPVSGRVTEIAVKKASRVEYGHKLFVIDPGLPEEEGKNA